MVSPRVLVIVPTHDHASTLDLAVASALAQTVGDLDIAIIGDGVGDDTRAVAGELMSADDRVRFIDAPKSASRSELVRHQVISDSDAELVTYLGDDDLFFPDHVEVMADLLGSSDFAHPLPVFVEIDESLVVLPCDISDPRWVEMHLLPTFNAVSLTGAAHTTEFYRRLPHGWLEPPAGRWSDHFFWGQVFTTPGVRARTSHLGTTVKAHATTRTHLSALERRQRLEPWVELVCDPEGRATWNRMVDEAVRRAAVDHHLDALRLRQQVGRLDVEITERNEVIDRLEATTRESHQRFDAEHAELQRVNNRIAELDRIGDEQRRRIADTDAELSALAAEMVVLREMIGELERQRDDRQAQLDAIGASRSWKVGQLTARFVHLPAVAARRLTSASRQVVRATRRRGRVAAHQRDAEERRETAPIGSSISDDDVYPSFCKSAAFDTSVFQTFRSNPIYTEILEHVSVAQGEEYLNRIRTDPEVTQRLAVLIADDALGGPRQHHFEGVGPVSPTTLRYVKVLVDLRQLFGNLDGFKVAEVGIGYGGQCRVIARMHRPARYELFDLPSVNALAARFLRESRVPGDLVAFRDGRQPVEVESDLLISNYAFSELSRDLQEIYIDRVVQHAKRGYVTYNHISPEGFSSMTAGEFAARMPGASVIEEVPLTHPENVIVVWGAHVGRDEHH